MAIINKGTASGIKPSTGAKYGPRSSIAGETISTGDVVYADTDGLVYKAKCNGTLAQATARGMACHAALAGQLIRYQKLGDLLMASVLTAGVPYYLASTAGAICLLSDLSTGYYLTQVGVGSSGVTNTLTIGVQATGITKG